MRYASAQLDELAAAGAGRHVGRGREDLAGLRGTPAFEALLAS
jgi:hypothetical protein